ncbi:hypothetical protein WJX73_003727 [Symbiochloris irregularis]|uniref:Saccharopine dehydrogenase NADP binding domain-containing protein n=1 Tax=Symbiochloris irregularis TaxID=706552 RepID=A0AAW1NWT6_9CHLO
MSRTYDVVVLGSTGTVGKLVCEHLADHYQGKIKWAMAARNKAKMEKVKQDVAKRYSLRQDIPLLVADATDQVALNNIAKQTKVIMAMSGPFAKLGTNIVKACLKEGTNYVDITGEVQWVQQMIEEHHDEAARKGVKIVHCCGFDSIPSEIGAAFMADHIQKTFGRPCKSLEAQMVKGSGGLGGGTIYSLLGVFESPKDRLKRIGDAYALDPPDSSRGPDKGDMLGVKYSKATGKWTGPFIMAPVNTRVVRRTNALLQHKYGKNLSYNESVQVPNLFAALILSALMSLGGLLAWFNLTRKLIFKLVPAPGTGVTREQMDKGYWELALVGETQEEGGKPSRIARGRVGHDRDPGYLSTSRMCLEAAICLATQEKELRAAGMLQGGILTPGSAMGLVLAERLKAAGLTFEIDTDNAVDVSHKAHHA